MGEAMRMMGMTNTKEHCGEIKNSIVQTEVLCLAQQALWNAADRHLPPLELFLLVKFSMIIGPCAWLSGVLQGRQWLESERRNDFHEQKQGSAFQQCTGHFISLNLESNERMAAVQIAAR